MFFKNKNPKIQFECQIPGVETLMPIIEAREHRPAWVSRAFESLVAERKAPDYGTERHLHVLRCPGIFSLMRKGYIVRAWHDIHIKAHGDGNNFNWNAPIDQAKTPHGQPSVSFHPADQLYKFMSDWPKDALKIVIKIHTPWVARIPKGYLLLELPPAYSDNSMFTVLPGVFDANIGPIDLNVQLVWNVAEGSAVIKAGTPLAQYILVKDEEVDFELTGEKATDVELRNLVLGSHFISSVNKLKKVFS